MSRRTLGSPRLRWTQRGERCTFEPTPRLHLCEKWVVTRSERLFQLNSLFLRREFAVTAHELSREFRVSVRTIYRDIASLRRQGIPIEGEAGVGYMLRDGYTLPPLAFTRDEIDALALGLRWVAAYGDTALGTASRSALDKISATGIRTVEEVARDAGLVIGHAERSAVDDALLRYVRRSIRSERKVRIRYRDAAGTPSDRTIWPVAIGYFETSQLVAAWCELRSDFRHFRTDRISEWSPSTASIPTSHAALFEHWRRRERLSRSQTGI